MYRLGDNKEISRKDINQTKRPRLAAALKAAEKRKYKTAYALSDIPKKDEDGTLYVAIIEESPAGSRKEEHDTIYLYKDELSRGTEFFTSQSFNRNALESLAKILLRTELNYHYHEIPLPKAGRRPQYTTADVKRIAALHDDGHSIRDIAKMLGMSPTTVHKYLQLKDFF